MDITATQRGKVTVVTLAGLIDSSNADQLSQALNGQVQRGHTRLVADVAGVEYISSAGLRALVQALKDTTRRGGDLRLARVGPRLQKALEISGLVSLLKAFPDVDSAVASFD